MRERGRDGERGRERYSEREREGWGGGGGRKGRVRERGREVYRACSKDLHSLCFVPLAYAVYVSLVSDCSVLSDHPTGLG